MFSCIDTATWVEMFYSLTGANRQTTTVQARASGENGNCKAAGAKEAASSMIVVIESSTVVSDALASDFIAAVESGSPAVAPLAVKSIAIVPGTEGAVLAGVPIAPTSVSAIAAGGAAGGAGAGAGGLSGGAIAGIVIGSVAGGVIAIGLAGLLILAVIVAAVLMLLRNRSNEEKERELKEMPAAPIDDDFTHIGPGNVENEQLEGNVSRTLIDIFNPPSGAIDVMNNPSSGHMSITARSGPQI